MSDVSVLQSALFFLLAAVIAVPLFRRFRLGAILGYLIAGVIIGPNVFHVIDDPQGVLHFSEIGVVLLLFIIGLELNPEKLWSMRQQILLLGGGQIMLTGLLIAVLLSFLSLNWQVSIIIGFTLALSSTAFAVQLMAERGVLASANGRRGFSILLMQDLAVIPLLLLVQAFANYSEQEALVWWKIILAIMVLITSGRFLLNPLLTIVARYGSRETMTATALLIVVGSAYLLYACGLSMGMGAFMAGIMLANSHFRHQLESDIEPFKGLTLGLFFIAIGMTLNIELLLQKPILILLFAFVLLFLKALIIAGLFLWVRVEWRSAFSMGLLLGQGGEFAFVIMNQATTSGLVLAQHAELINLVVGISMVLTAPMVVLFSKIPAKPHPAILSDELPHEEKNSEVLILGFGRFAQITGRILAANSIPFTALDNNPAHIQFIKHFGNKIHFGDITRLDILQAAGIEKVHTVLVTIEDGAKSVALVKMIREHYPDLVIIARAYNRVNYLQLVAAGANKVIREIFSGSLEAAHETLTTLGFNNSQALRTIELFRQHDEKLLDRALQHHDNLEKVIEIGIQGRLELEELFSRDKEAAN